MQARGKKWMNASLPRVTFFNLLSLVGHIVLRLAAWNLRVPFEPEPSFGLESFGFRGALNWISSKLD